MSTLSDRLRERRAAMGLSLVQVSRASGVSKSYLHQLEHGRSIPTVDKVQALAVAYHTTVAYLVGETADEYMARLVQAYAVLGEAIVSLSE